MKSHSALTSNPATSSDDPSTMTAQPERPEQGRFSKGEADFLKTHLAAYEALCHQLREQARGPRGTQFVKGRKKDWVLSKVFPLFVEQFSSNENGGPQLQSLQTKLLRWFTNHSPRRGTSATLASLTSSPKRPRATNGANVFAKEQKEKITQQMAEYKDQEGGNPKEVNLARYHTIKQELYNELTNEERHVYEAKAGAENEARRDMPGKSMIFDNQGDIVGGVVKALHSLIGWDWYQYGEAVFFVQGAYRNADNVLKSFNVSVSPDAKVTSFASTLSDYKKVLRAPFREWADNALPADQNYDLQEDVIPRLPIFNIDLIAPNDARSMLKTYIELAWKFMTKPAFVQGLDLNTVPWDLLNTASLRGKLLVNPEPFSHVKTLDPMRMSPHDVYDVLALLVKGQDSGKRILEFSIGDTFNSDVDSISEITELSSPRDDIIDAATELDNDVSERSDSPIYPPKDTANSKTSTASPRDEGSLPLQSTPPLSESVIKVAIKNVAEAGYLRVLDADLDDAPNQVFQRLKIKAQQDRKGNANNSKKRRQEEVEEVHEDEQKKKHKGAIPARAQSSRLKDANYKNKHVTVRPR